MGDANNFIRPVQEAAIIHPLSNLLPYDPAVKIDDRLEAGLKEYLLLLNATLLAMAELDLGNLGQFDPLVGENFCQIRAVKLALTIQNCAFDIPRLVEKISLAKAKIEEALTNFSKIKKRKISLNHYLVDQDCEVLITKEECFLIKSFILTRTKVLREDSTSKPLVKNDCTDTKKIKEFGDIGSLFAKNFVAHLRKRMSKSSVNFVQSHSSSKLVSDQYLVNHNGLHCVPCYWSTKVAIDQAKQMKTPIVMYAQQKAKDQDYKITDKTTIYFAHTASGYQQTTRCQLDPEIPALILEGTTCRDFGMLPTKETWIQELIENCPTELVLAYAAAHRQYPDETLDGCFSEIEDNNYHDHKRKASNWGCSLENPSLFFLAHAYCERIKNLKHV